MAVNPTKLVIISHAGIKQINRSVYGLLKTHLEKITLIIPARLELTSGQCVEAEPARSEDPVVIPLSLAGKNPRTYYYPRLGEILMVEKPTVIILEGDPVSRLGVQLARWCKKNRCRLICQTYENLERDWFTTWRNQGWKAAAKNLVIHWMNTYMASRVDDLIVVNEDSRRIAKGYGYSRIHGIPLGYDNSVFFPDDELRTTYRSKTGIDQRTVLIAYFGRLVPQKGVHLLLQALDQLAAKNWKLMLDHLHDQQGIYSATIKNTIRDKGWEDKVIFFEADHFEIASYMRAADIAVSFSITTPTFKEQYGRAVQEAMACGCVCVVSDSGHLKDLVGDSSLVCEEGNVNQLSTLLELLIGQEDRRINYKHQLTHRAATNFTIRQHAYRLLEIVNDVSEKN